MAFSSNSAAGAPMADSNVSPLVAVMLLLLIIFMLTPPILSYPIATDRHLTTTHPPPEPHPPDPAT